MVRSILQLGFVFALLTSLLPAAVLAQSQVTAADVRALLTTQLGEHVLLAAAATGAALHGNDAEFEIAATALDGNSQDLAATIGLVYGDEAAAAFLPLWRAHIDLFVDYTLGVAAGDDAARDDAYTALDSYRAGFGEFLAGANPNLTQEQVAEALVPHIMHLTQMIDAQGAQDYPAAYRALRMAYNHSGELAAVLAWAIVEQFPDRFSGQAEASASGLRALLSSQLAEHTFLAAMATNAALQEREAEFDAAAAALDSNSVELAASIGSVYGQEAANGFLPLWRNHIALFVDYTLGVAAGDQAMQDEAAAALDSYRATFGDFLAGANPYLPTDTVAEALGPHITGLMMVIDAQAAQQYPMVYEELRMAYAHAGGLGGVLAGAIAQQFPDQFMAMSMPQAMPDTGFAAQPEGDLSYRTLLLMALLGAAIGMALLSGRPASVRVRVDEE
jgi:hypothetical protein